MIHNNKVLCLGVRQELCILAVPFTFSGNFVACLLSVVSL